MSSAGVAVRAGRPATEPPEARGLARDGVRLLVAEPAGIRHRVFADLPALLGPGDLVVVNTSRTLAAAVDGHRRRDDPVAVHFSTALDDGCWAVELRPPGPATGPVRDAVAGERIDLRPGGWLTLLGPYPELGRGTGRLWRAAPSVPGSVERLLARHGRPIRYAYVPEQWPLRCYQTVFARDPGSAEMPSAGRPFTARLVTDLVAAGVAVAPVTLHTGVSSLDDGEPPLPERFRVPPSTARLVNLVRASGGRVVAVGTTVARAVESAAAVSGVVAPAQGWTDLLLSAVRPVRAVTGLITGWHAAGASHLRLLEAVAGAELVEAAYREALREGYRWHEFGDSCLLLPARIPSAG